jgi:1,2-dihydroxy-3-keto-5-methylthiopentene dioxygenase
MFIRQGETEYRNDADIARLCDPLGIERDRWDVATLGEDVCREAAKTPAHSQKILDYIRERLETLKARNGYLTEDIVCLSPETPNLADLLAMFDKEHHHTDDEVRAVLSGRGVFGIVPPEGEPFEIHVEAGDLIVVPAYTRHWFTLYPEQFITALRVFKTPAGWKALYEREPETAASASTP